MWADDNPDQLRYPFDPWHDELIRMGFSWRYGLPNEYSPDGRKVARFYWKDHLTRLEGIELDET